MEASIYYGTQIVFNLALVVLAFYLANKAFQIHKKTDAIVKPLLLWLPAGLILLIEIFQVAQSLN